MPQTEKDTLSRLCLFHHRAGGGEALTGSSCKFPSHLSLSETTLLRERKKGQQRQLLGFPTFLHIALRCSLKVRTAHIFNYFSLALPARMSVGHVCAWCPARPKGYFEGIANSEWPNRTVTATLRACSN